MLMTRERFERGMSFDVYVASMQENREKFIMNYAEAPAESAAARAVVCTDLPLRVLVLTEDWCGDALTYVPLLGRLAAGEADWTVRVFRRDENPDLADRWLKDGVHRAVPVFVFFDANMHELGHFIERPAAVNRARQALIDTLAAEHPGVIVPGRLYADQTPEAQELLTGPLRELRIAQTRQWQEYCAGEIAALLRCGAPAAELVGAR